MNGSRSRARRNTTSAVLFRCKGNYTKQNPARRPPNVKFDMSIEEAIRSLGSALDKMSAAAKIRSSIYVVATPVVAYTQMQILFGAELLRRSRVCSAMCNSGWAAPIEEARLAVVAQRKCTTLAHRLESSYQCALALHIGCRNKEKVRKHHLKGSRVR